MPSIDPVVQSPEEVSRGKCWDLATRLRYMGCVTCDDEASQERHPFRCVEELCHDNIRKRVNGCNPSDLVGSHVNGHKTKRMARPATLEPLRAPGSQRTAAQLYRMPRTSMPRMEVPASAACDILIGVSV